jgi:hypothetical protein
MPHGASFLRHATLEQAVAIYEGCVAALAANDGGVVVSLSGGGESITYSVDGALNMISTMNAAMRQMERLAPSIYPPRRNRHQASFSSGID